MTDDLQVRHADEPPSDPPEPWRARLWRLLRDGTVSIVLLVALWVGVGWLRAPDLPPQAPPFTLERLDGGTVSLAELRGRTVVLNFWATWCGPCRMEAPTLSAFAKANPEIPVLGIAVDGAAEELRKAAVELGIDYPVLLGEGRVAAYGVSTLPTTIVVGPEGEVRSSHAGLIVGPHLRWMTWW